MATGMSFDIAKAGWLYRQSSFLHRWKKNWFVLYRDGDLKYFESNDNPKAEERIVVRAVVTRIDTGPHCRRSDPPEGMFNLKGCFLELHMREKESMLLCAESADDMKAWQVALEEARTLHMNAPRAPGTTTTIIAPPNYMTQPNYVTYSGFPYGGVSYPGQVINTGPPAAQVVHTGNGTTTILAAPPAQQVVYMDDSLFGYRRHRCHRGGYWAGPNMWW